MLELNLIHVSNRAPLVFTTDKANNAEKILKKFSHDALKRKSTKISLAAQHSATNPDSATLYNWDGSKILLHLSDNNQSSQRELTI